MKYITLLFLFINLNATKCADLYWIGNSGNWSDNGHWSLSSGGASCNCSPGPSDNVYFDMNSFTQSGSAVTISQLTAANNINWTGVLNSPTLTGNFYDLYIFGSLTLSSNMQVSFTGDINFYPSTSVNFSTANVNLNSRINIAGNAGGSLTLNDSLITTDGIHINSGQFHSSSENIKAKYLKIIANGTSCNINLAASEIELSSSGSTEALSISGNALQFDAGTSHIRFTGEFPEINVGRFQLYDASFTNSTTNATAFININGTDTATFHDLSFAGKFHVFGSHNIHNLIPAPGKTGTFRDTATITITGTIISNGNCSTQTILTGRYGGGTTLLTTNPITVDYMILSFLNASPGGSFTANNSVDLGFNSGWNFNAASAIDYYWIGGKGEWHDPANWSLTSGGSPTSCIPFINDNVHFDSLSFLSAGDTVYCTTAAYCNSVYWNNIRHNPVWNPSYVGIYMNGSLYLDSGIANITGTINLIGSDNNFISSENCPLNTLLAINCNGTYQLLDSIHGSSLYIYHTRGSFNSNNQNLSAMLFYSTGNFARALTLGSSEFSITGNSKAFNLLDTGLTLNAGTSLIRMKGTSTQYLVNEGYQLYDVTSTTNAFILEDTLNSKYHNIYGPAGISFNGDREVDNLILYYGKSYTFTNHTTTITGTILRLGNSAQARPNLSGYQIDSTFIYKASGQLCTDSLNLNRMHARGGAQFYAGLHSNNINNSSTGWLFQACVPIGIDNPDKTNCTLYPVPTQNELFINCDDQDIFHYSILNASGIVIKQDELHDQQSIKTNDLQTGIYILKMTDRNGAVFNRRFIKK